MEKKSSIANEEVSRGWAEAIEKAFIPNPGEELRLMLEAKKFFLNILISKNKLPWYPIDLRTEPGQAVIRDFSTRMAEELSELFSEIEKLTELTTGNANFDRDEEAIVMANLNEEFADVVHFMLNIVLYSGLDYNAVLDRYHKIAQQVGSTFDDNNPLDNILSLARLDIIYSQNTSLLPTHSRVSILRKDALYCVPNNITLDNLESFKVMFWEINHEIQKLINLLKIRYWRTEDSNLSSATYTNQLYSVLDRVFVLLSMLNFTSVSLARVFYIKHYINLKRISKLNA